MTVSGNEGEVREPLYPPISPPFSPKYSICQGAIFWGAGSELHHGQSEQFIIRQNIQSTQDTMSLGNK